MTRNEVVEAIEDQYEQDEANEILSWLEQKALSTKLNIDQVYVKYAPEYIDMEPEEYECTFLGEWPEGHDPPRRS